MPEGTNIYSVHGGKVTQARSSSTYGNVIDIDDGNGRTTRYAHLKSMNVSLGDKVEKDQLIALSGNTGATSGPHKTTGPHLHLEDRMRGTPQSPSQEVIEASVRGKLLSDNSIILNAASRPDPNPAPPIVVPVPAAAPAAKGTTQGSTSSAYNIDMLPELWKLNILSPGGYFG
jgi:murein DD-endopeptidase MepM/ murein hydrolase activator NlpD